MSLKTLGTGLILSLIYSIVIAAKPDKTIVYKTSPNGEELKLFIFYPSDHSTTKDSKPVMLMYQGGGWRRGNPQQFFIQCQHYAEQGFVAISTSYRLSPKEKPQNTVFHAVEDARSAICYIKNNAKSFGIDSNKIITTGSSARAHLAIATSVLKLDAKNDDLTIDPTPATVILMCPVVDAGPKPGYAHIYKRIPNRYKEFSQFHNLHSKIS